MDIRLRALRIYQKRSDFNKWHQTDQSEKVFLSNFDNWSLWFNISDFISDIISL